MINEYVVLDLEMTGLSAKTDQIIEIGAVKIKEIAKGLKGELLGIILKKSTIYKRL